MVSSLVRGLVVRGRWCYRWKGRAALIRSGIARLGVAISGELPRAGRGVMPSPVIAARTDTAAITHQASRKPAWMAG